MCIRQVSEPASLRALSANLYVERGQGVSSVFRWYCATGGPFSSAAAGLSRRTVTVNVDRRWCFANRIKNTDTPRVRAFA